MRVCRVAAASVFAAVILPLCSLGQAPANTERVPRTWVDKDTGHRVWRMTDEANSGGFYFNINAYTPDHKQMIYTAPDGIHVVELATKKTKLLVANPAGDPKGNVHALVVGNKTDSVFYTQVDPKTGVNAVYKADTNTGAVRKLTDIVAPPHTSGMSVVSVNADETLVAGTYIEGDATNKLYGQNAPAAPAQATPGGARDNRVGSAAEGPHYQPTNKGQMMEARLEAKLPLVLFTIRLEPGPGGAKPGDMKVLLHSTDWVNHLLFSPKDLIHKRTMLMEIAGHEFWGLDGETIWYDWQYPKGEDFFLAGYNLQTGRKTAYHMTRNEWSIHFNLTQDLDLFTGDGGDPGQVAKAPDGEWIELFHPQMVGGTQGALNAPDFWQPGVFHSEHLVNMSHHYYREEPNVRFSPDKTMVFFTSNMFGPSYLFGVEVAKAADMKDAVSTPELAKKWNPKDPPTSKGAPQPM